MNHKFNTEETIEMSKSKDHLLNSDILKLLKLLSK